MTAEDRVKLNNAIQEFYDNTFNPNKQPEISDNAKAIALRYMIMYWNENSKTKIGEK